MWKVREWRANEVSDEDRSVTPLRPVRSSFPYGPSERTKWGRKAGKAKWWVKRRAALMSSLSLRGAAHSLISPSPAPRPTGPRSVPSSLFLSPFALQSHPRSRGERVTQERRDQKGTEVNEERLNRESGCDGSEGHVTGSSRSLYLRPS